MAVSLFVEAPQINKLYSIKPHQSLRPGMKDVSSLFMNRSS
jgi:hypothetical protein